MAEYIEVRKEITDNDGNKTLTNPVLVPKASATEVELAAGANPTKAEFDALVNALAEAGYITIAE